MQTTLKTFRLPTEIAQILEKNAQEKKISQTDVLINWINQVIKKEQQWKNDLKLMASDHDYQIEQIKLSEENYE